tara:strand:- start:32 stop:787 length:756 start_codon:yes stop_codon:yes gene_type:complete
MKRIQINLNKRKKIFFAGDFHLGAPDEVSSKSREKKIIKWLDSIENCAQELFLMGDLFDFWIEYKHVVPKNYFNLLHKISRLIDKGVNIHFFKGNHDMWTIDFFESIGIKVYDNFQSFKIGSINILVGHGDGLGKGDMNYKIAKSIFKNNISQFLFRLIHPDIGIRLGSYLSKSNKRKEDQTEKNNKRIYNFCKNYDLKNKNQAYIFGHSHMASHIPISNSSDYYNTGEWIKNSNYVVYNGEKFKLKSFKS